MFRRANLHSMFHIGQRNTDKATEVLKEYHIPIIGTDIGDNFGRSIEFDLSTGKITVYKAGGVFWTEL